MSHTVFWLAIAGFAFVFYGLFLIYEPLAFVALGLLMVKVAYEGHKDEKKYEERTND